MLVDLMEKNNPLEEDARRGFLNINVALSNTMKAMQNAPPTKDIYTKQDTNIIVKATIKEENMQFKA